MKKKATFHRLLGYMWRYRMVSIMALTFILLTTLVTTALPLLARYFIDQFIGRNQAWAGLPLLALYNSHQYKFYSFSQQNLLQSHLLYPKS